MTLDELENTLTPETSPYGSILAIKTAALRRQDIATYTVEDLRLMIGQKEGLAYLMPLALEVLANDPLTSGDYYEGDLLTVCLQVPQSYWAQHPHQKRQLKALLTEAVNSGRISEVNDEHLYALVLWFHAK